MQDGEHVDRGVEQRQRVGIRGAVQQSGEQVIAEVFLQHQTGIRIGGDDVRRRQAEAGQMRGDAEKRAHILGRRRIHQHRRARPAGQAEIAAEARVLGQRGGAGGGEAGAGEKGGDGVVTGHPRASMRSGQPDRVTSRAVSPAGARITVKASAGRNGPSWSGHSTSTMSA